MSSVVRIQPDADVPVARAIESADAGIEADRRALRGEWCLRAGAAACFIGHGAFGILTKEAWIPYFGVVGISRDSAYLMMPIVGTIDVAAGLLVLVSPRPLALAYMVVWGMWTALLRPLAGESFFETLERAGNYGVPLALALLLGVGRSPRAWLSPRRLGLPIPDRTLIGRVLLGTTATLLFAHGALQAITRKPSFESLYAVAGVASSRIPLAGWFEMTLAILAVIAPAPALLILIAVWKLATELLFPMSGAPIWEFVERGGSYAAPIALVILFARSAFTPINLTRSSR